MFVPFLYELRARKVKVGAQEAMAMARALSLGLHDSSLDGFYHVAFRLPNAAVSYVVMRRIPMKVVSSTLVLAAALAVAWGCTTTVIHETAPAPASDSGTVDNDSGTGDPDVATQDPPDTSPPPCQYPPGPYGTTLGAIVAPTWTWQGYVKGSNAVTTLKITDLYDCDGTKGITAVLIDEAALWCGPCNQEAMDLPAQMNAVWTAQGVVAVSLVVESDVAGHPPATTNDALRWRDAYGLGPVANSVADPNWTFAHTGSIGLPQNLLVDPRTMKIVHYQEGYGGVDAEPEVSQLALKNKK